MQTSQYLKEANFRCDCCGERVTHKGGYYPFYLCDKHAPLAIEEIVKLKAAKCGSSERWIAETIDYEQWMTKAHGAARYDERGRPIATKRAA